LYIVVSITGAKVGIIFNPANVLKEKFTGQEIIYFSCKKIHFSLASSKTMCTFAPVIETTIQQNKKNGM